VTEKVKDPDKRKEMAIQMPKCTGCNREISQDGKAVKFPCPGCGEEIIWRCGKCRTLSNEYECPECGFVGP